MASDVLFQRIRDGVIVRCDTRSQYDSLMELACEAIDRFMPPDMAHYFRGNGYRLSAMMPYGTTKDWEWYLNGNGARQWLEYPRLSFEDLLAAYDCPELGEAVESLL